MPKQRQLSINLVERYFRQGLMHQTDPLKAGGDSRVHILFEIDVEVVCFTRLDSGNFCHFYVFYVAYG